MGTAMEQYRPFAMEEPVPFENIDAMQRVAESIRLPIASGERLYTPFDFEDILSREFVAIAQPA